MNRSLVSSSRRRSLRPVVGVVVSWLLLALLALLVPVSPAVADTQVLADGASLSFESTVQPGESIRISGSGWLAKPEMVDEGEEGSVVGFKLIDGSVGQLERTFGLENPRLGDAVANQTVWGVVWADSAGGFTVDLPWPDGSNVVTDPAWGAGDSFTVQVLSGTMYSDQASVDPSLRPDVSRSAQLTITVADDTEGEPEVAPVVTTQPESVSVASGSSATFSAAADGGASIQWQRSQSLSATAAPANWITLTGETNPTLTVTAGTIPAPSSGRSLQTPRGL